jgi:hypothetical protein
MPTPSQPELPTLTNLGNTPDMAGDEILFLRCCVVFGGNSDSSSTCRLLKKTYLFIFGLVLHRTLGGIKLMNMVDDVRTRFKDSADKMPSTMLILILVRPRGMMELNQPWNTDQDQTSCVAI